MALSDMENQTFENVIGLLNYTITKVQSANEEIV